MDVVWHISAAGFLCKETEGYWKLVVSFENPENKVKPDDEYRSYSLSGGNGSYRSKVTVLWSIYRFANFHGIVPDSMDDVLPEDIDTVLDYPDADSISDYAKTAALYCQTTGIIGGCTGGVFAPKERATRAEVAAIVQRFAEAVFG